MRKNLFSFFLLLLFCHKGFSQSRMDSLFSKLDPQKFATAISDKANRLQQKLGQKAVKTLQQMQQQERKLYEKMLKGKDSLIAKARLQELEGRYSTLRSSLNPSSLGTTAKQYIPTLDSLNTSLKFLDLHAVNGKVNDALAKTNLLQGKFDQAEQIKKFIKERKELLKQQLERLGLVKQLKKINKTVYYYSAQVKEYKEILSDPKKVEKKALELLSKTKFFQDFMRKNSMLASLFRMPDPNGNVDPASLIGLQTRVQVNGIIQQQITAGGAGAAQQFNQSLQSAQSQLNELKNKILKAGGGSSDEELPDFKPNSQKTKSFFKRLEFGTNIQSQKATGFFPVTTDLGLSAGYKLNDKSIIGLGASYKLGLGRGWNHIKFSNEGIGLRAYMDLKLKGSFWISGGYEQNYRTAFADFQQLQNKNAWQKSGLIGLSKVMSIKSKFFKKTNVKLLWDFLSYQQVPRTQALLFRVGYNF